MGDVVAGVVIAAIKGGLLRQIALVAVLNLLQLVVAEAMNGTECVVVHPL